MNAELYKKFVSNLPFAYAYHKMIKNAKGNIVDFEFLEVNKRYETLSGLESSGLIGKRITEVFLTISKDEISWLIDYTTEAALGSVEKEKRYCSLHNKWFQIIMYVPEKGKVVLLYDDITSNVEHISKLSQIKKQQDALLKISLLSDPSEGNFYYFLKKITQSTSEVLEISNVGVWFLDEDGQSLRCFDNYDSVNKEHSSGMILHEFHNDTIFYHLINHKYIAVTNIQNDERIGALSGMYLKSVKVGSLLYVAILSGKMVKGMLSAEHSQTDRIWSEHDVHFLKQLAEQITFYMGCFQKKTEQNELRKNQEMLCSLYRAAPVGIGLVKKRILYEVNDYLCEMIGYSREELLGQSGRMLYASQEEFDRVGIEKYAQMYEDGVGVVETLWKTKKGKELNILLSSSPLDINDQTKGVTFTAVNISKRRLAEKRLKQSEARYQSVIETQQSLIARFLPDTALTFVNQAYCQFFQMHSEEMLGRKFLDFLSEEQHAGIQAYLQLFNPENPVHHFEGEMVTRKGKKSWMAWTGIAIFDEKGKIVEIQWSGIDRTDRMERQKLEEQLAIAKKSSEFQ